jgi:hypothetical protein
MCESVIMKALKSMRAKNDPSPVRGGLQSPGNMI